MWIWCCMPILMLLTSQHPSFVSYWGEEMFLICLCPPPPCSNRGLCTYIYAKHLSKTNQFHFGNSNPILFFCNLYGFKWLDWARIFCVWSNWMIERFYLVFECLTFKESGTCTSIADTSYSVYWPYGIWTSPLITLNVTYKAGDSRKH